MKKDKTEILFKVTATSFAIITTLILLALLAGFLAASHGSVIKAISEWALFAAPIMIFVLSFAYMVNYRINLLSNAGVLISLRIIFIAITGVNIFLLQMGQLILLFTIPYITLSVIIVFLLFSKYSIINVN